MVFDCLPDRISSKILVSPSGCWIWQMYCDEKGYGIVSVSGKRRKIHRVVFEAVNGPVLDGLTLDHLCRVKGCCNPSHLDPCTAIENKKRSAGITVYVTSGVCRAGLHKMEGDNLTKDLRKCRACSNARSLERYYRNKGAK